MGGGRIMKRGSFNINKSQLNLSQNSVQCKWLKCAETMSQLCNSLAGMRQGHQCSLQSSMSGDIMLKCIPYILIGHCTSHWISTWVSWNWSQSNLTRYSDLFFPSCNMSHVCLLFQIYYWQHLCLLCSDHWFLFFNVPTFDMATSFPSLCVLYPSCISLSLFDIDLEHCTF